MIEESRQAVSDARARAESRNLLVYKTLRTDRDAWER